jgi:hypothetical protein
MGWIGPVYTMMRALGAQPASEGFMFKFKCKFNYTLAREGRGPELRHGYD